MPRILRAIFSDLPFKILALVIAVFLWFIAVLDRSYVTSITVPVVLGRIETKKIISDFETHLADVTFEGKGKDLLDLHLHQPEFRLTVSEGRAGIHQLKLKPADLKLPRNLTVRSIAPEYVKLKLNEVRTRRVKVKVPLKGQPPKGFTITRIRPGSNVQLTGPKEDIGLFATVFTESLNLGKVRQTDTLQLRVVPPEEEGFSTKPESVPVVVTVEKEEARIFLGIPVKTIAPKSLRVRVKPTEAQIAVAGPSVLLNKLKPTDITARIKISGLKPGHYRLAAEIVLPVKFHLIKCEPSLFNVTIQ